MKDNSIDIKNIQQKQLPLKIFNEIGKALVSSVDLKGVLKIVMEQISKFLHPKNWSLLLLDEKTNELKFELVVGERAEKIKDLRLKLGEGIAGWVALEKKPVFVPDVEKDPRFCESVDEISDFKTRSIVCMPLIARDKCLGVIELINIKDNILKDEDLLLLSTISDYAAIAIENAKYFDTIQELTITDELTKLYNMRFLHARLMQEIERARRFKNDISLLFMDLNSFKEVNDKYGHACGDKVLKEFASLILKTVRNVDMAYRYGGDEFIILMSGTSKKGAIIAAERIGKIIEKTALLNDSHIKIHLTASIGVASYPSDAKSKDDLIKVADDNMYKIKNHIKKSAR